MTALQTLGQQAQAVLATPTERTFRAARMAAAKVPASELVGVGPDRYLAFALRCLLLALPEAGPHSQAELVKAVAAITRASHKFVESGNTERPVWWADRDE